MKIAVLGGTGFVGSYIVNALIRAGHAVSMLVREGSEQQLPDTPVWRTTSGDINDQAAILSTTADCDAVVYCIGLLREYPRRGISFENTQYEGVVRAISAAKSSKVQRFALITANGIKATGTAYQSSKYRAEKYLLASGLDATIFRPSVIFGDPGGRMEIATQLYRDMVATPLPAVGFFSGMSPRNGQILMSPAYIGDVAGAVCNALSRDDSVGKTYTLGGPEVLSWTTMIRRIAASTNRSKWMIPVPIAMMKLAATLLDWIPAFPVTRDQLTMLAENNIAAPDTLEDLVGNPLTRFDAAALGYLTKD